MAFQIYDILYIVFTLIALIVGKSAARFFGKRSSVAERHGLLATLEKLAEFAVTEIERLAQSDKPHLKGEAKKKEAVKLLLEMLTEAVPAHELKHVKLTDQSKLLRGAVERKVHEKHLSEGKKANAKPGETITTIHLTESK